MAETGTDSTGFVFSAVFGEPDAVEGGVNWDAYTHEELYEMLHTDADVSDVSTVAADWAAHREALAEHAQVLRDQQSALLADWTGSGAEEAARRLTKLADRVEKLAEFAGAGQVSAEQAAEALARARNAMPKPSGAGEPVTDPASNFQDLISGGDFFNLGSTTPSGAGATTPSSAGDSVGAVGGANFSFYAGSNTSDVQKSQAVRAMQTYESELTSGQQRLGEAQRGVPAAGTMPAASTPSTTTAFDGGSGSASKTRPSWQKLVGSAESGTAKGLAAGVAAGALLGGGAGALAARGGLGVPGGAMPGTQLAPGMRAGGMAMPGGAAAAQAAAAEAAAARGGGPMGMVPPGGGGARGGSDDKHESQMPMIDHELFPPEEPGAEVLEQLELEVES